jgi:hypothetical protein|tara:strand:- start:319 stop:735 length:417 start_codon:yes stop_codon:yes gene_type:complete
MFLNKENNMKRYTLIHSTFLEEGEAAREVAVMDIEQTGQSRMQDLETVFIKTQNLDGSWSMGKTIQLRDGSWIENEDYDERVVCLLPLKTHKGRQYGMRSTSVGDHIKTDCGELWICASMGWERVDELEINNYRAGRA